MTDFEKLQLRQRVMEEMFDLNSNVINIKQLISVMEKHGEIHDKKGLERDLQEFFTFQSQNESVSKSSGYLLSDLIQAKNIKIVDQVDNWHQSIEMAAQPLLESGAITENYIHQMKELYPDVPEYIVLGRTIAIPHAAPEDGVNEIGMSLLKVNNGLILDDENNISLYRCDCSS